MSVRRAERHHEITSVETVSSRRARSRPSLARLPTGRAVPVFGLTPPRRSVAPDEATIADVTLDRLAGLDLDGLLLYDSSTRASGPAPESAFPYLPTIDHRYLVHTSALGEGGHCLSWSEYT